MSARAIQIGHVFCVSLLLMVSAGAAIDTKVSVFVRKAVPEELSETLTYPARVENKIKAQVLADAEGVVSKIQAPLGSTVKSRQTLLVIRNMDPVYEYSPLAVVSPVAGIVSRVDVSEGSRVARGDALMLVTDPKQVRVVVEVTAQDLPHIRTGMTAEMTAPGHLAGEAIKLRVKGVSPFVDPTTGTATCELEVLNGNIVPGVMGRAVFKANVRKGFSLPESAITYRGRDPFLRVVAADKAKLVAVTIGRKQAGMVEILSGIKAGDEVVERASGFVADGSDVVVQRDGQQEKKN